jgi:hypothetical protein
MSSLCAPSAILAISLCLFCLGIMAPALAVGVCIYRYRRTSAERDVRWIDQILARSSRASATRTRALRRELVVSLAIALLVSLTASLILAFAPEVGHWIC